jgi:hypothetical protein
MADPTGEADRDALRLDFDRRLMLQFRGSVITSDGGLLAYRELDDTLGLTDTGADVLADARTGKNSRHLLVGLLRQSVFGRLAGYEDVNDADRLCRDPAMRWVVGGKAPMDRAASASQMGRFETEWLAGPENLAALADLPGQWIDAVHKRRQPRVVVLDMDSSESPTYGAQEGSAYNGHFGCTCVIIRCLCSTSLAIWSGAPCARATCTAPPAGTRGRHGVRRSLPGFKPQPFSSEQGDRDGKCFEQLCALIRQAQTARLKSISRGYPTNRSLPCCPKAGGSRAIREPCA